MTRSRSRLYIGVVGILGLVLSALVFRLALLPPPPPTAVTGITKDDHSHDVPATPPPLFGANSGARRGDPGDEEATSVIPPRATAGATPAASSDTLVFAPARFQATPVGTPVATSATPASG